MYDRLILSSWACLWWKASMNLITSCLMTPTSCPVERRSETVQARRAVSIHHFQGFQCRSIDSLDDSQKIAIWSTSVHTTVWYVH
jgi:hypothetical protein